MTYHCCMSPSHCLDPRCQPPKSQTEFRSIGMVLQDEAKRKDRLWLEDVADMLASEENQ